MRIGYDAKRIFHNTTGLGNYSRHLVRTMARFYPEYTYILYNPKPPRVHRLDVQPPLEERRPRSWWKYAPSLWRSRGILKNLRRDGIDLYHGLSGELPLGISRTGIPSVLTVHDVIFWKFPHWYSPADRLIYTLKLKRALKEASAVVAVSKQTKADLVEMTGIDPERVQVIYQSCDPVFKKDLPPAYLEEVRRKYSLPREDVILYVGTLEPRKNAMTLVKALSRLPYSAVFVGRMTPYGRQVKKFAESTGMQDRVKFLSGLSLRELAALYRLARVSVYPSIYEGFGIPIIESLYAGTPVITNARGVFREAAGPGGIYLSDVTDPAEMEEKLRWAMTSDLGPLREAGLRHVRRFDDDRLAGRWHALYRKLAGK
ncbi:MAG: glycosyltransferase family 4 protein [Chlorobi bacterium]|nr:glycosyltransferase family 4 protein [Chlorobiota bacterium]